jgi:hypothetical protein
VFRELIMGWFWVVGFGDNLRGRRESVLKINFLSKPFHPTHCFGFLPSMIIRL